MALHGSIERVRLDRSRCAGEPRMPGVVALRHSRMAFHMSVPSFVVFFMIPFINFTAASARPLD